MMNTQFTVFRRCKRVLHFVRDEQPKIITFSMLHVSCNSDSFSKDLKENCSVLKTSRLVPLSVRKQTCFYLHSCTNIRAMQTVTVHSLALNLKTSLDDVPRRNFSLQAAAQDSHG